MKTVNRYIIIEFLKLLLLFAAGMTIIYMVVDLFENLSDFTKIQTDFTTIVIYFLLRIPQAIYLIAPISFLFASFINLGLFSKYNEITAMRSSGINSFNIASSKLIITLIFSLAIFLFNDTVVPATNKASEEIKRQAEKKPKEMFFKEDSLWFKSGKYTLFNVRFIEPEKNTLWRINVYYLNNSFEIRESISADKAVQENGQWFLETGIRRVFNTSKIPVNVYPFDKLKTDIPFNLKDVKHAVVTASETRFGVLKSYVEKIEQEGYDVKRLNVDLFAKTSFPFAGFILTLIGISLAFFIKRLGGIASGAGVCIVISMLYWVSFSFSLHLGYAGHLPPLLSAWLANIVFLAIGGFMFFRAAKL
ncbi:MAG: LPS export ABC transporter permease LptG [Nitrospirae bacterium]|nr:LPS export ABC transporter permease LptG [Nitrospirota bacterium]